LTILDIIHLSNKIELDSYRKKKDHGFSERGSEGADTDTVELELFVMDDVNITTKSRSSGDKTDEATWGKAT